MSKKNIGYTLIILSIFLTFGIIGNLKNIIVDVFRLINVFTLKMNSYEVGVVFGSLIGWIIIIFIIILLLKYGRKFIASHPE